MSSHSSQIDREGRNCAVNEASAAAMGNGGINAHMVVLGDYLGNCGKSERSKSMQIIAWERLSKYILDSIVHFVSYGRYLSCVLVLATNVNGADVTLPRERLVGSVVTQKARSEGCK